MHRYHFITRSAEETRDLASRLGALLQPGDILALSGNLASGKTTFTQGLAACFQVAEYALSPTFTYINEYHGRTGDIIHIDAYRLKNGSELVAMGIWDYFESNAIIVIEWADIVADIIPAEAFGISFRTVENDTGKREILINAPRALELTP